MNKAILLEKKKSEKYKRKILKDQWERVYDWVDVSFYF